MAEKYQYWGIMVAFNNTIVTIASLLPGSTFYLM